MTLLVIRSRISRSQNAVRNGIEGLEVALVEQRLEALALVARLIPFQIGRPGLGGGHCLLFSVGEDDAADGRVGTVQRNLMAVKAFDDLLEMGVVGLTGHVA